MDGRNVSLGARTLSSYRRGRSRWAGAHFRASLAAHTLRRPSTASPWDLDSPDFEASARLTYREPAHRPPDRRVRRRSVTQVELPKDTPFLDYLKAYENDNSKDPFDALEMLDNTSRSGSSARPR